MSPANKASNLNRKLDSLMNLKLLKCDRSNEVNIGIEDLADFKSLLAPGRSYKLIKCKKVNNTIRLIRDFKPIQVTLKVNFSKSNKGQETLNDMDFRIEPCNRLNMEILVVKVITMQRLDYTKEGSNKVCNIKDFNRNLGHLIIHEDGKITDSGNVSSSRRCNIHYDKQNDEYYCPRCGGKVTEDNIMTGFRCKGNGN